MNETKQVVFIRPNDVLFSYDLIIIDIYNQLRQYMEEDDRENLRIMIESSFNDNLYLYSIRYSERGDIYFVSDMHKNIISVDDYDKIIISKKHKLITHDAWEWLSNSKYIDLLFKVNISFFNRTIIDIEDGFNLFVITFDSIYPESFYVGRFFKDKNKMAEKVIAVDKLANWLTDQLRDKENGSLNTIWITDDLFDPFNILDACIDTYNLDENLADRIMLETTLVVLNENNMKICKDASEQEHMIGSIGVINPFMMGILNSLYNTDK